MSISEAEEETQHPKKCVIEAIVRNPALEILKVTQEGQYVVLLFSAVNLAKWKTTQQALRLHVLKLQRNFLQQE